jgi:hypothetical protein
VTGQSILKAAGIIDQINVKIAQQSHFVFWIATITEALANVCYDNKA